MSKRLTSPDEIRERIETSYDPEYYGSIYSQINYAFGESFEKNNRHAVAGEIPDWPNIQVRYQEIGRSRRILNAAYLSLAKNMYSSPVPLYQNLDIVTREVRQGFWQTRHRLGEWQEEMANAYLDFDQLGVGFCQVGYKRNPKTGMPMVSLRHSPLLHTFWDMNQRNPGNAEWVAFLHYTSKEKAVRMFGDEAKQHTRMLKDTNTTRPMEVVRFFEYFDTGFDEGTPTRALILDSLGNEVKPEVNQWGFLPMSYGLHFLAPGMRRPIGRIAMQMATQEALNEVERHMRKMLRRPGFDIADTALLDEQDLNRVASGDTSRPVKFTGGGTNKAGDSFIRIHSAEMAQSILALRSALEAQYNADSGTTDFSRGAAPVGADTLGENMLIDQRSREQASQIERQTLAFAERTIRVVMDVAAMADRDPVSVPALGQVYTVNDPLSMETSSIAVWMAQEADMIVDPQSLRKQDTDRDMARELGRLEQLAPLVGVPGGIDTMWFTKKKLEAIKETDFSAAMAGGQLAATGGAAQNNLAGPGAPPLGPAQAQPAQGLQEHDADQYGQSYAPAVANT